MHSLLPQHSHSSCASSPICHIQPASPPRPTSHSSMRCRRVATACGSMMRPYHAPPPLGMQNNERLFWLMICGVWLLFSIDEKCRYIAQSPIQLSKAVHYINIIWFCVCDTQVFRLKILPSWLARVHVTFATLLQSAHTSTYIQNCSIDT
jgi:hypothetical protein